MPGLYIHVPFCIQKCPYCDFASFDDISCMAEDYTVAVIKELKDAAKKEFDTLFIGGGTPTALNEKNLDALFSGIFSIWPKKKFREITIEANPETITPKKAKILAANATRVSMGCQSFRDAELKKLGRIHDSSAISRGFALLRDEKIENINLDIIYGIEGQGVESALYSVSEAIKLSPEHISFYMMTLYEDTPFGKSAKKGELKLPDDEIMESIYMEGCVALENAGYSQYEISNFSRAGRECIHNLNYWNQGEYLGTGPSAASYLNGKRRVNTDSPAEYIKKIKRGENAAAISEEITPDLYLKEHIMLRLRTVNGIDTREFKRVFNFDFNAKYSNIIKNLMEAGLARAGSDSFNLTRKGFLLSNEIIGKFF